MASAIQRLLPGSSSGRPGELARICEHVRRSTEHIEIVPQETCIQHSGPDTFVECVTITTFRPTTPRRCSEPPRTLGELKK
ncbi:unnamed protein product [Caenorhabditis auriculariae]|uniref:Uncharacterized protein n=1 Tax=Caenorhabditis auriculariae TaxID=2777116 RepID=A0A8S1GT49_9PELO|nr:unnamed protein product [Caenorhabditis auriculariae]